ncbi:MAG: 4-vinyl reductase [Spirochaetes bacterium]|nr:4-vinyl reductase [Spirochaetota bacterium]
MENVFSNEKDHGVFSWANLGDIKKGRGALGDEMPVLVYRLMQFTMLDVLTRELGKEKAKHFIREAGYIAGKEFTQNVMDISVSLDKFVANLQKALQELKIGILRIESLDEATGEIMLTVAEDLDCSGLPITGEAVCNYDEGFIAGILEAYTTKPYAVREIDCWANGSRVCRFRCTVK